MFLPFLLVLAWDEEEEEEEEAMVLAEGEFSDFRLSSVSMTFV